MSQSTNEADIAAVTETVRTYYDGMMAGDEAKLARAPHPRACIVGSEQGELYWVTLVEFVSDCKKDVAQAGPHEWRIDGLSFEGDTALVRLGGQYAGDGNEALATEHRRLGRRRIALLSLASVKRCLSTGQPEVRSRKPRLWICP